MQVNKEEEHRTSYYIILSFPWSDLHLKQSVWILRYLLYLTGTSDSCWHSVSFCMCKMNLKKSQGIIVFKYIVFLLKWLIYICLWIMNSRYILKKLSCGERFDLIKSSWFSGTFCNLIYIVFTINFELMFSAWWTKNS